MFLLFFSEPFKCDDFDSEICRSSKRCLFSCCKTDIFTCKAGIVLTWDYKPNQSISLYFIMLVKITPNHLKYITTCSSTMYYYKQWMFIHCDKFTCSSSSRSLSNAAAICSLTIWRCCGVTWFPLKTPPRLLGVRLPLDEDAGLVLPLR